MTRSRETRIWSAWVEQGLAALRLLDLAGAGEKRVEVAVLADELGGGLDADAGGAGDVVDGVAGQRLDVDDAVGADAELLDHLVGADRLVLQGVEHDDARGDELHQVLVGGDDGDPPAGGDRLGGVGGDDVVGLEARHLDARQVEGAGRVADQAELRDEVIGRGRAVLLVLGVELVAEGDLGLVEDDGDVGRRVGALRLLQHLPHHVGEAGDGADGQAVGLAGERRQGVVGAEDEARAVDQVQVAAGSEAHGSSAPRLEFRRPFYRGGRRGGNGGRRVGCCPGGRRRDMAGG